jgi:hypothetical protein
VSVGVLWHLCCGFPFLVAFLLATRFRVLTCAQALLVVAEQKIVGAHEVGTTTGYGCRFYYTLGRCQSGRSEKRSHLEGCRRVHEQTNFESTGLLHQLMCAVAFVVQSRNQPSMESLDKILWVHGSRLKELGRMSWCHLPIPTRRSFIHDATS